VVGRLRGVFGGVMALAFLGGCQPQADQGAAPKPSGNMVATFTAFQRDSGACDIYMTIRNKTANGLISLEVQSDHPPFYLDARDISAGAVSVGKVVAPVESCEKTTHQIEDSIHDLKITECSMDNVSDTDCAALFAFDTAFDHKTIAAAEAAYMAKIAPQMTPPSSQRLAETPKLTARLGLPRFGKPPIEKPRPNAQPLQFRTVVHPNARHAAPH